MDGADINPIRETASGFRPGLDKERFYVVSLAAGSRVLTAEAPRGQVMTGLHPCSGTRRLDATQRLDSFMITKTRKKLADAAYVEERPLSHTERAYDENYREHAPLDVIASGAKQSGAIPHRPAWGVGLPRREACPRAGEAGPGRSSR